VAGCVEQQVMGRVRARPSDRPLGARTDEATATSALPGASTLVATRVPRRRRRAAMLDALIPVRCTIITHTLYLPYPYDVHRLPNGLGAHRRA
jgi:hypothetical protein